MKNPIDRELLMELEGPLRRLSGVVNAMLLMVSGMEEASDPYADGFYLIWTCLQEVEEALGKIFTA